MCKWVVAASAPCISPAAERALLAQMAVAEVTGVRLTALCANGRGDAGAAFARQMAMYLCHFAFAMSFTEVGQAFGRDRTTAGHAVRRIEEARENPEFDGVLQRLEDTLHRAGGIHG
jgi:chromosomal replication initiation ATPase DnaA